MRDAGKALRALTQLKAEHTFLVTGFATINKGSEVKPYLIEITNARTVDNQVLSEPSETFIQAVCTDILDFGARVLAIHSASHDRQMNGARILETLLGPRLMGRARSGSLGDRLEAHEFAIATGVSSRGHAAAFSNGHVSQDVDRLAATRARRAAAARDIRSAGTASSVPEYISSGVCPRNAECGSTWLCSWT